MINAAALRLDQSNVLTKVVYNGVVLLYSDMVRAQAMIALHIPKGRALNHKINRHVQEGKGRVVSWVSDLASYTFAKTALDILYMVP